MKRADWSSILAVFLLVFSVESTIYNHLEIEINLLTIISKLLEDSTGFLSFVCISAGIYCLRKQKVYSKVCFIYCIDLILLDKLYLNSQWVLVFNEIKEIISKINWMPSFLFIGSIIIMIIAFCFIRQKPNKEKIEKKQKEKISGEPNKPINEKELNNGGKEKDISISREKYSNVRSVSHNTTALIAVVLAILLTFLLLRNDEKSFDFFNNFLNLITDNTLIAVPMIFIILFVLLDIFITIFIEMLFKSTVHQKWISNLKSGIENIEEGIVILVLNLITGIINLFLFIPDFLNQMGGILLEKEDFFPTYSINENKIKKNKKGNNNEK